MNILIFTTSFHPAIGGLERQTLTLIYEFLKLGYKVKIITVQSQVSTSVSVGLRLKEIDVYYQPAFLTKINLYMWCDIFYMPNISLRGIWLLFFNPFKKLVISHNDFYLSNKQSMNVRIKLLLIKLASHNIAVSKSVASYLNTKVTVIYNCYDDDIFKIYNDEKRIYDFVFLGRLVSQKGCEILIKACSNLKRQFTLNIIGEGPEKLKLQKLVHNLGLEQNIKFVGILEGEQLARMLNRHQVMVIPSVGSEGFGIVALEGMACGCKIIASDAGGLPEAVSVFGRTFKMCDQKELELSLEEVISSIDITNQYLISTDLCNFLEAHNKETIAKKYLSLFN